MEKLLIDSKIVSVNVLETNFTLSSGKNYILQPPAIKNQVDFLTQIHTHSDYELFFLQGANLKVVQEDCSMLTFNQGLVLIPPGYSHFVVPDGGYIYRFRLSIAPQKKTNLLPELFVNICNALKESKIYLFPLSSDATFYITKIANLINQTSSIKRLELEHVAYLLTLSIIETILPKNNSDVVKRENDCATYNTKIEQILSKYYMQDIDLDFVAKKLFLSKRQTSRVIFKAYGKTFPQILKKHRLNVAKMLLKNTSLKIEDIIVAVGFETPNYFFRLFREEFNITPLQYRKNQEKTLL